MFQHLFHQDAASVGYERRRKNWRRLPTRCRLLC